VTVAELADRVRAADPRSLARAISIVEREGPEAAALVAALYSHTGRARMVGITGAPGAGKSTLVDRLAVAWRSVGRRVGIVAVDPSSAFTGGALLGDRVRMQQHTADAGVFIRSMATRGHLGGLAPATSDVAVVLDAAGYDVVVIETVGVGQDEIEIVRTADVSIVVIVPGAGDDVQALKAGIMEIADIYVVNKADREGTDRTVTSIESLLSLESFDAAAWRPPILRTEAATGSGIASLVTAIDDFLARESGELGARRRRRSGARVKDLLARQLMAHVEREVLVTGEFEALLDRVTRHEIDPHAAAASLARRTLGRR
jgi:LAO/AO transport system kinase